MKLSMIAIVIACLLTGAAGGYSAGYLIYEPEIRSYEIQVSDFALEVSRLSEQVSDLTSEVSTLSQTISSREAQISTLELEKSGLQSDLAGAQALLMSYEQQVTTLNSQVSDLKVRLNNILDVTVTQHYEWVYGGETWQWELAIPLSLYVEYLERPRLPSAASCVDMAKDPQDDRYIDEMIQQINSAAIKEGFTEFEKVNFVIAFIQSLPYTVDVETTPYNEYPRYPVETLFDRGGDCEDTSILVAALLDRMGYDIALLHLEDAKHMAVGVSIAGTHGSYYEYGGKRYFYLETTGEGWQMGQIPPTITDTTAYVYPVGN